MAVPISELGWQLPSTLLTAAVCLLPQTTSPVSVCPTQPGLWALKLGICPHGLHLHWAFNIQLGNVSSSDAEAGAGERRATDAQPWTPDSLAGLKGDLAPEKRAGCFLSRSPKLGYESKR